jgi:hypothetical protein
MSDKPTRILKFKSVEVKVVAVYEDGTEVEQVVFNRVSEEGFPAEDVQIVHEKPWLPFFSHPADLNPAGFRQSGPLVTKLILVDRAEVGSISLNDGTFVSVNNPKLEGRTPEEYLQRPAAVSQIPGSLTYRDKKKDEKP